MTESSIRPIVEAFYRASAERDVARVMAFIADDVNCWCRGRSTCSRSSDSGTARPP